MKCIVIEDEIPAQKVLKNYISKLDNLELIGTYQSALKANSILKNEKVDLVFMDINLPDISGLQYIRTLVDTPKVIMTTAYPNYAAESYEVEAICDYLVKPFSFERFLKAVNKVKSHVDTSTLRLDEGAMPDHIFINVDKTLHRIQTADILYIESEKNYLTLVTVKTRLSYLDALKNWIDKLPVNFIQVHKSYIVNIKAIEKISGNRISIRDFQIPVGRTYKSALSRKLRS